MGEPMIQLENLTKRFGSITAVDNVTFSVKRGEVLGFLGPNGAGKSTTMRMLTCFTSPTEGTAKVCGYDIRTRSLEVRRKVGYLPEGAPGYPDMTPAALLGFIAEMRGLFGARKRGRIAEIVEMIHLDGVLRQPFETLSKGFKRRVALALALIHDPEVLVLDEPTDGLDPNQKFEVRSLIKEMSENKAIIISTHILEEVDALCTRAIIIDRGKLVADDSPANFLMRSRLYHAVTVIVDKPDAGRVRDALRKLPGVASVEENVGQAEAAAAAGEGLARFTVLADKPTRLLLPDIQQALQELEITMRGVFSERGSLDEVFRSITVGDGSLESEESKSGGAPDDTGDAVGSNKRTPPPDGDESGDALDEKSGDKPPEPTGDEKKNEENDSGAEG